MQTSNSLKHRVILSTGDRIIIINELIKVAIIKGILRYRLFEITVAEVIKDTVIMEHANGDFA